MHIKILLVLSSALYGLHSLNAKDYFWVGGSGNWSDISHWVTTSGGTVQHSTIPTSSDRVFFDSRSFTGPNQTVTVTNPTIFLKDMNWSGAIGQPIFFGPPNLVMEIYGSLVLIPEMVYDFKGDVIFKSSESNNLIDLAGHKLLRNTTFSGLNGEWVLQSSFEVDSLLKFETGIFKSSGKSIFSQLLLIDPIGSLFIDLDNSHFKISGISYSFCSVCELQPVADIVYKPQLTLNAENATLEFNSTNVYFRIRNTSTLNLGTVVFSNRIGKSLLKLNDPNSSSLSMRRLTMLNDSELIGSMKIDELDLGEGKNFIFNSGRIYEIVQLNANGACNTPIQLFSSEPGKAAIFRSNSGNIMGSSLSLRDIHATGGASFKANDSNDLGNNMGWIFSPKANDKLYWVGGTGIWNNPNNWSLTSGGPGGACVPTAGDDVFFDENSFATPGAMVTINLDNAYCRSMDWTGATGNPSLKGTAEKNLHIFGSMKLNTNMIFDFDGDLLFESNNSGNQITSFGKLLKKNTGFNGQGSWTLMDKFMVQNTIHFIQGNLNTNDQELSCEKFISNSIAPRNLKLGNSHITMKTPDNREWSDWFLHSDNLVFDAGTSQIEFLWFGILRHSGESELNYHKVKFNLNSNVSAAPKKLNHIIDTLEMLGSGFFQGNTKINIWIIYRGTVYETREGDTLIVQKIIPEEGCNKLIEFRSSHRYKPAFISHHLSMTLKQIIVQDFPSIGPGTLSALSSANLGNSDGWVINEGDGRILYWVGGSGLWHDTSHWSLTSGGAGGECIPTPIDDVIFDENSFSTPDQRVGMNVEYAYCKNIIWRNLPYRSLFQSQRLNVFGSIETSANIVFESFFNLVLRSENDSNQIKIGAAGRISFFDITGGGSFILQDSLLAFRILHYNGTFHSNNYDVNIDRYWTFNWDTQKELILGGSHWKITGNGQIINPSWLISRPLIIQPDSSLVEFTNPTSVIFAEFPFQFHNVLFSANEQQSIIQAVNNATGIFNRLEFRNNGIIVGAHTIDSLIFSPGKSYQLDATKAQMIKTYFQVIGNNCLSISLSSTILGQKSKVIMNGGTVLADFVQMRDQITEGSTNFFAGNNSTNIGNSNIGWLFESAPGYVDDGILGKDIVLCKASTIELDSRTFSPNETYLWSNGANTPTLTISQSGTYWVDIKYGDNCTLRDTINIIEAEEFIVNLPNDTALCFGDTLRLEPELTLTGLTYLWQDSSTISSFVVREPGHYKVTLELTGCTVSDSLLVSYIPLPAVNLGPDLRLCPGQTTTLDAFLSEATAYKWQNGSTLPSILASTAGEYAVEVFVGRCFATDTVLLTFEETFNLTLGKDTAICEGAELILIPMTDPNDNVSFSWQNGSSTPTFLTNTEGIFWVDAIRNGCTERDSISISIKPLPRFELGPDTTLCEGEQALLEVNIPGANYLWNNGGTSNSIQINSPGSYWLQTQRDGCFYSDSLNAFVTILPKNILGEDRTICEGQSTTFDASMTDGRYLWQNGSTSPNFIAMSSGTYTVQIMVGRCIVEDTVSVFVDPLPIFDIGQDTQLCFPVTFPLQINADADSYLWQDGSIQASLIPMQSGLFKATAIKNGCSWTDSIYIEVIKPEKPNLGNDTTLCENTNFILQANINSNSLVWQDGSKEKIYQVKAPGEYILTNIQGDCEVSDTILISYRRCSVLKIYIPNAFSPNGDGINETFKPLINQDIQIKEYVFRIFDRWGSLVFETNDIEEAWDGAYQGKSLQPGVYLYFIYFNYKDDFKEDIAKYSGDLQLTK